MDVQHGRGWRRNVRWIEQQARRTWLARRNKKVSKVERVLAVKIGPPIPGLRLTAQSKSPVSCTLRLPLTIVVTVVGPVEAPICTSLALA
jgi:hypothetical protein